LPVEHLALTKAHRQVEGDHRAAAWRVMLDHVAADKRGAVLAWMDDVLAAWQRYRDEVALACGIARGADGAPTRKP
jgi:pyrroloquinoline-quinone synthase